MNYVLVVTWKQKKKYCYNIKRSFYASKGANSKLPIKLWVLKKGKLGWNKKKKKNSHSTSLSDWIAGGLALNTVVTFEIIQVNKTPLVYTFLQTWFSSLQPKWNEIRERFIIFERKNNLHTEKHFIWNQSYGMSATLEGWKIHNFLCYTPINLVIHSVWVIQHT